jgi:hypothetical protein
LPTIQQQIADKFLKKLSEGDIVDPGKIEQLRALLGEKKKSKAEDFIKIFTTSDGGDLK